MKARPINRFSLIDRFSLLAVMLLFIYGCGSEKSGRDKSSLQMDIWYGDQQRFGKPGITQKWINILGNLYAENGLKDLNYTLNAGPLKKLTVGSDLHRLAATGDFNIDIHINDCHAGENIVLISAVDSLENTCTRKVEFFLEKGNRWPLPYTIKWSDVENIQDVVQVIDGHWEITGQGLHNLDTYYDRVVAFGDTSWKSYEVSTSVIFHSFKPPAEGPPTYNVSHAAIAMRWTGHDEDDLQPHRKWYPLGATAEFRLTQNLDSCRWRIFDGPKPNSMDFHTEQPVKDYRKIQLNRKYGMKHRVSTVGKDSTLYQVKLWPFNEPEPVEWDFQGIEVEENYASGSALLIAHNTSVTFGDVTVRSVD
jgi:hypothetical protein